MAYQAQAPIASEKHGRNRVVVFSVCLMLLIAGVLWYALSSGPNEGVGEVVFDDLYTSIAAENTAYAEAEKAALERDHEKALALYQKALESAETPREEEVIRLMIALTTARTDRYITAIPLFKQIAADTSIGARTRAYAVQMMANMYTIYSEQRILDEIFKDAPYSSLRVIGKDAVSRRNLYQYATSLYPIGESSLRVATWYSNELLASKKAEPGSLRHLTEAEVAEYRNTILTLMAVGDTDILYLQSQRFLNFELATTQLRKAILLASLDLYGDTSFGDAEAAYMTALQTYTTFDAKEADSLARYNYAVFLAQKFGASRATDIQTILAPLYSDPQYADAPIVSVLKGNRTNANYKPFTIIVADVDPKFKAYLMTLGWAEADFNL